MLLVLALTLLFGSALVGWGASAAALLERLGRTTLLGEISIGEYGLLGLAVLAPIALLLHLFIALDAGVGSAILLIGFLCLAGGRRRLLTALGFGLSRPWTAALLLGLALAIAGETLHQHLPYDSGLYHLQTILMAEDSRIVLGAVNIHSRFGYNSAWLLLCAALSFPGQPLGAAMVLNGVVALFGLTGFVQRIGSGVGRGDTPLSATFAAGAVLLIALSKLLPHNIGGPSTDFTSGLLTIYSFLLALAIVEAPAVDRRGRLVLIALPIAAMAIICKTSQVPAMLAILLAAAVFLRQRPPFGRRLVAAGMGSAALLGTFWLLHGLALSGCALYPVSASCLGGLPWTVPRAVAQDDLASIASFARIPDMSHGLVPDDWHWVHAWLAEIRGERLVVCLKIVLIAIPVLLVLRLAARQRLRCLAETLDPTVRRAVAGLLAVAVLGVCYWFLAAPALRFGFGFLVTPPLILLGLAIPVSRSSMRVWRAGRWVAQGIAAVALILAIDTVLHQPAASFFATELPWVPTVELDERQTSSGQVYFTPKTGDRCWASPRFCTPYTSPGIEFARLGFWRAAVAPH